MTTWRDRLDRLRLPRLRWIILGALVTAALLALMCFPLKKRWQEAKDDVSPDGAAPA